jgi:hypothetical protein
MPRAPLAFRSGLVHVACGALVMCGDASHCHTEMRTHQPELCCADALGASVLGDRSCVTLGGADRRHFPPVANRRWFWIVGANRGFMGLGDGRALFADGVLTGELPLQSPTRAEFQPWALTPQTRVGVPVVGAERPSSHARRLALSPGRCANPRRFCIGRLSGPVSVRDRQPVRFLSTGAEFCAWALILGESFHLAYSRWLLFAGAGQCSSVRSSTRAGFWLWVLTGALSSGDRMDSGWGRRLNDGAR